MSLLTFLFSSSTVTRTFPLLFTSSREFFWIDVIFAMFNILLKVLDAFGKHQLHGIFTISFTFLQTISDKLRKRRWLHISWWCFCHLKIQILKLLWDLGQLILQLKLWLNTRERHKYKFQWSYYTHISLGDEWRLIRQFCPQCICVLLVVAGRITWLKHYFTLHSLVFRLIK